jgi:hypothetical protein
MFVVKSRTKNMIFTNEDAAMAIYRELKKDRRFKDVSVKEVFSNHSGDRMFLPAGMRAKLNPQRREG